MAPTSRLSSHLFSSIRHARVRSTARPSHLLLKSAYPSSVKPQLSLRASMATKSPAGEAISQVAQAEGGTSKGSVSAQMQSELTKQMNEKQDTEIMVDQASETTTPGEMISQVAKAEGGPTKGSVSAQMQSELAKQMNEKQDTEPIAEQDTATMSAGEVVSAVAKAEGGPSKGSASAQLQSELTKQGNTGSGAQAESNTMASNVTGSNPPAGSAEAQAQSQTEKEQNFVEAAQVVGAKMQNDPSSVTLEDASYLESRTSRAMGGARPPSDSMAAEAKRMAAANEQGTPSSGTASQDSMSPNAQKQADREANFQAAVDAIKPKIENDPDSVTKEDANLLHSRERRAHGNSEKGGIAAQAQRIVAEREKNA